MPFPLLIALFVAFGIETPGDDRAWAGDEVTRRAFETGAGVVTVALFALVLGRLVALRVERAGPEGSRRFLGMASRALDFLTLGIFAWIVYDLQWPSVVRHGFGLIDGVLVDEVVILLPYLLMQVAGWVGLHRAEHAIRAATSSWRGPIGVGRYVLTRARQTLGMVLPMALIFALVQDLAGRAWPRTMAGHPGQLALLAAMGLVVLLLAPVFVRLSWPTRRLPPGPLRDRLERLSARLGFRYADILIWDTDGMLVNAGVTGTLPSFRYVLLTDALVSHLSDHQVAAVFGHEVGHVMHRHLVYLGFFLLGSLGVLVLTGDGLDRWMVSGLPGGGDSLLATVLSTGLGLLGVALYFLLVFGYLSRRFERQADVYGCRAVSCGRADCPPHADLDATGATPPGNPRSPRLCPVGIRMFINALDHVAALNGLGRDHRSWRHGSIGRRIAFLEGLEGRPDAERQFQRRVLGLRLGLALALIGAVLLAFATGTADGFR